MAIAYGIYLFPKGHSAWMIGLWAIPFSLTLLAFIGVAALLVLNWTELSRGERLRKSLLILLI